MNNEIVPLAKFHGADLVGIAGVRVYSDYLGEVIARLQEAGATGRDYMPSEDAMTFFETLSDLRLTFSATKSIVLVGAHSFYEEVAYRKTKQTLQGKTARTYACG